MKTLLSFGKTQGYVWSADLPDKKQNLPLILFPTGENPSLELEKISPILLDAIHKGTCSPFRLAAFSSLDWNKDFTPWPAPPLFAKEKDFQGKASDTLGWIESTFLPAVYQQIGYVPEKNNTAIIGYSLAGLFSLWAFYESNLFSAVASCSGSLWYDNWLDYVQKQKVPINSAVYLSLGDKEELAKNPKMATVGAVTRTMADLIATNPAVTRSHFQQHPGGHFTHVHSRLAQGIIWLAKQ
ncbi:MAG: alpha/beta hydrolase [Clostridiales bacterium]|nr:alpha/beta hydrolase [Clostridiales bacterium]